ncbi:MAG TPA: hypothetical protein VEI01_11370 [Terriglobales bacterium]|nr:hypothetical protein [Terriglobales bacterium]
MRVVYRVPADRPFRSKYSRRIKAAISNLQMWYREQMGNGETFRLTDPVLRLVHTSHTASWYETSPVSGADASLWFWFNALADGFSATGAQFFDPYHHGFSTLTPTLCAAKRSARPKRPAKHPGVFLATIGHGRSVPLGRRAWS